MAWVEQIYFNSEGFVLDVPRWDFPDQGIICVLGESGAGKSTLLQIMAGLIPNPHLRLSLQGELISELPARSRNFGFVFQDYALFPHLSALENISFAAEAKGLPQEMWRTHGEKLFDRLGLRKILNQKAQSLSGGEQQRVALARALITKPRMVLLDEPLSALDEKIKDEARSLIMELSQEFQVPFILVTHDLMDARTMSRDLLLLSQGRALAGGATAEVLDRPPSIEAARAISENQIFQVGVEGNKAIFAGYEIDCKKIIPHNGDDFLVIKNWGVECRPQLKNSTKQKELTVKVLRCVNEGPQWRCSMLLPGGQVLRGWAQREIKPHEPVDIEVDPTNILLFKKERTVQEIL